MAIELNGINAGKLNRDVASEAERNATEQRRNRTDEQRSAKQKPAVRDEVTLSRDSQNIERLTEQVRREDSFDSQRVEKISAAIAEGRYPVDSQRVAEKFLELERQLY